MTSTSPSALISEVEVASFLPAKLLPLMAAAAEIVKHALTLPGLPGLTVMALVPRGHVTW